MPTMFKKARELYENCGVNVTLVTEDEGVYHFYNTAMMTQQEVFERYLLLIQQSPQAFVTEVPILDPVDGTTTKSPCAESTDNPPQDCIHAVCMDDLEMSMDDADQINAHFQAVAYVSATESVCTQQNRLADDQMYSTDGPTCGATAGERKKIRQEQERRQHKQVRLDARNAVRRKKREEFRNKTVTAANANACESRQHTNTLRGVCVATETTATVQKRKQPAVLATSKHENALPSIESSQKKSKITKKLPADSVEQNAAHDNTMNVPTDAAHGADWLSSIKQKLSTTADSSILLRNDPIFAMFANF